MSKIVALETATAACSVALWLEGQLFERFEIAPRRHAALILPMVDSLLEECSLRLDELDAIAFGCGPGAFMGVRIAAGVAQGLAFGVDLPVIPVSTLQTLAQVAYEETAATSVLAGWDARMEAIYWGTYCVAQNLMQPVIPDALNFPAEIELNKKEELYLAVGNAWEVYEASLPHALKSCFSDVRSDVYPQAGAMAKIAAVKFSQGEVLPPHQAQPIYLRSAVTGGGSL